MDEPDKLVNPEMVVLARQSRGMSQRELAQKLSMTPGWLCRVESGLRTMTEANLRKLSEVLDYPVEFFLNSQTVYGPGISEMYHRKRQSVPSKRLDKIHALIDIRRIHLVKMLQGVEIGDTDIRTFDLDEFDGNPSDIARAVRASWNLPRGSIRNLTRVIEDARGMVIPVDFETRLIDALSYWPPNTPPLFFIDIRSPGDRLRFSLCHELGHIVMHQDAPNPNMEREADQFASEFLMPEKDIRPYLDNLTLEKLAMLKPFWKVSMAALLKRATDLGEITPRHARTLWIKMGKAGFRSHEPIELDIPVEHPTLLQEIVGVYSNEMRYSISDLAKMLHLHEHEVCSTYFGSGQHLIDEDLRAAIEEAERIIRGFQKDAEE